MNWMTRKTLIYHVPVTRRMPSSSGASNRSACIWFQNKNRRSLLLPIMIGILLLSLTQSTFACVQENIPPWITDGPILEDTKASLQIPLKTFATKLFIEIELGGIPRRFVLDTGSPSMIDARLAEELGLVKVGSSRGRDAHGHIIQSEVVQANLKIGGVWIKKVPMYKARFSDSVATQTFIGDGVLGSEILKLGAWQIDLKNSLLRFNVQASALPFVADVDRQTLYDFGYPHSPIFDVHFSKSARSKAMLDTGSPNYFAISPDDFRGAKNENGIGHMISGFGSPGSSLGGASCRVRSTAGRNEQFVD